MLWLITRRMKLLDKIREEEVKKYGPICDNEDCGNYQKFCRCESYKKYKESKELKKALRDGN